MAIRTDNDIIATLVTLLNEGFTYANSSGVTVMQKNQPTREGIPSGPAVFIEKLFDRRYGFPKTERVVQDNGFVESLFQKYDTTFQISARSMQYPGVDQPTASDLLNTAASILQSTKAVTLFQANKAGLYRIVSAVSNNYLQDDQDRPEASPSFDIGVSYTRVTPIQFIGKVTAIDGTINAVP